MKIKLLVIILAFVVLVLPKFNFGQAPNLGSLSGIAVFTASGAFTNTGATMVTGDIGTHVGAFTGFPPGTVIGAIHVADAISAQAATDVATAYGSLSAMTCGTVLGIGLGNNQILVPGIYCIGAAATLNGILTLDGQGNPDAIFIIKIDAALASTSLSSIALINAASAANVYWQINGSFTLGTGTIFMGTVIANGAIEILSGSSLFGRALSVAGSVSINNNVIMIATPPMASVITASGPTTFCANQSVVLSGNVDGTWNTGATTPSITVNTAGDYYVVNTNSFGSVTSNHILVTVNPMPVASVITSTGSPMICEGQSVTLSGNSGGIWSNGSSAPSITANSNGDFYVTNTNSCGSIISNYIYIIVIPLPIASTISANGPTTICQGQNVTLTGNSDGTWNTGAVTPAITVSTTGDYYVTNTNYCGNVVSNHMLITVNPLPATAVITANGPTTFCPGGSVVLSGNTNGTWNTGASTPSITVSSAGDYYVNNTNSCGTLSSNHILVSLNTLPLASVIFPNAAPEICEGDNLVLSGNVNGTWNTGATTPGITVNTAGSYFVTNTNSCGSVNSNVISVSLIPVPVASVVTSNGPSTICEGQDVMLSGNTTGTWSTGEVSPSITVNTAGDYYVTNTNSCGSVISNHIVTTLIPLPLASIIIADGPLSVCQGTNVILSGNIDGTWNTGAMTPTITVSTAGDYFITNTNLCGSVISNHIVISMLTLNAITCPPDISAFVDPGTCFASNINPGTPVLTDFCPGTTLTNNAPFNYPSGTTYITWLATDIYGNTVSCIQTIVITDNNPPVITCPPDVIVNTDPGLCYATLINPGVPGYFDNCYTTLLTSNSQDMYLPGTTVVTWIATDASGNTSSCQQNIIVTDNQVPQIICPEDIIAGSPGYITIPAVIVNDNCGIASLTNSLTLTSDASGYFAAGTTVITWTVTDIHGNSATCMQTILVNCTVIALNDSIVMAVNTPGTLNLSLNDTYCQSAVLCTIITILVPPVHVTASLSSLPGTLNIANPAAYTGTDSLLYQSCCLLPDDSYACDTAWAFITILNPPTAHISGGANICAEIYTPIYFTMTGQPPFTVLYTDGTNVFTLAGIMTYTQVVYVHPLTLTNYTIISVQDASGLSNTGTGMATINVFTIPHFIVTGGGSYCPGDPGVVISLSGSTPGIIYQLLLNNLPTGATYAGTGQTLDFGTNNVAGNYTVSAFNPYTGCTTYMYGDASSVLLPGPAIYNVTGGGECCVGCYDIFVGLSNSQIGVTYSVWLNYSTIIHNIPGTGGPLDFGLVTQEGIYTVTATDSYGCTIDMSGQASVIIHPRPVGILTTGDYTICEGDSIYLWFEFSAGHAPYSVTISTGDSIFTIGDIICSPIPLVFHPDHTTTYTLLYVNDTFCINYGQGSSTITVIDCLPTSNYTLSGQVRYNNINLAGLSNVSVTLRNNNAIFGNTMTDVNGNYQFNNLAPGSYTVEASTSRPFGGINATDALIIMRHFTQVTQLTGINLLAADVNASNFTNSLDALLVARRYVHMINAFPAGDWVFETQTVNITNASETKDILGLCYGDVNGSYQPMTGKESTTVRLNTQGNLSISSYDNFEITIQSATALSIGAITLVLNYPEELLEVMSVTVNDSQLGNTVYQARDGELRIAWFNTQEIKMQENQRLLSISCKAKNLSGISDHEFLFQLGEGSTLASRDGTALDDVELLVPKLVSSPTYAEINIYPNPTHGNTRFEYSITERSQCIITIYDMLGKVVAKPLSGIQETGKHSVSFDALVLPPGIYTCRFLLSGTTQARTIVKRLEILK